MAEDQYSDIVGLRFGKLVVLERLSKTKNQAMKWRCQCDCGKTHSVTKSRLIKRETKSCGCLKERDITGQRFGKLVAICVVGRSNGLLWKCRCDCGKERVLASTRLRSGSAKKCGSDCKTEPFMDWVRSRVVITGNGCWEWRRLDGRLPLDGHRPYRYVRGSSKAGSSKGTITPVAQMVYDEVYGPIKKGLHVLHTCDYVFCVRPDHLYAGTPKQNAADRAKNGKQVFGREVTGVKLTDDKAIEIFETYFLGNDTLGELAAIYDVTNVAVFDITHRRSWRRATQDAAERLGVLKAESEIPLGGKRFDRVRALVQERIKLENQKEKK